MGNVPQMCERFSYFLKLCELKNDASTQNLSQADTVLKFWMEYVK